MPSASKLTALHAMSEHIATRSEVLRYLDVDAVTVGGVGAALSQRDDPEDPESHAPLAFYSRRFDQTERGYPVRDQECMGLVESVVEWRPYILGYKTIVRTDHKSLKWLMTCQHPDGSRVSN